MRDQPEQLCLELALGLARGLLDGDHHVAEHAQAERALRDGGWLPLELREGEHVGRAIDPAVVPVERVDLEVPGQDQRQLQVRARGV